MSAGSLMWVWWGPPPPVPFPLVLISQVDEHISSSPNPSPRIPPHMSTMHTNRHTCVNTAHVRESRVTWCTGPQWKSNNNKKKCCLKRSTVSLFIHSWNEEKEAMTHTCTYTHCDESDIYQPGFKSSQIVLCKYRAPASGEIFHFDIHAVRYLWKNCSVALLLLKMLHCCDEMSKGARKGEERRRNRVWVTEHRLHSWLLWFHLILSPDSVAFAVFV